MEGGRGRILFGVLFAAIPAALVLSLARPRPAPIVAASPASVERQPVTISSYAPIVSQVAPSVVNIFSSKTVQNPLARMQPYAGDPLLNELFGDEAARGRMPQTFTEQNLGSGIIVTADGYVLTNNHVVEGADRVRVALSERGEDFEARVIGRDPKTDLAVVKIESDNLPAITFGDSDSLMVGDVVLAVGNPFGVGQTVTSGIVSAVKRGLGMEDYDDLIQTDAAINPRNSGGPLVDMEGRLVGVSTAILSRTGGSMGIGFAVPVNLARHVMQLLIETG